MVASHEFGSSDLWLGLLFSLLSAILFGSGFVLIKRQEPRDGIFTQWMMCNGIMLAGFFILAVEGFPRFYPAAALGGAFWAMGNSLAVPIFIELSLGAAYLLPDTVNCLGNFLIGYFGLFWTTARPPRTVWLALVGLVTIITGGIFIALVENVEPQRGLSKKNKGSRQVILTSSNNKIPFDHDHEANDGGEIKSSSLIKPFQNTTIWPASHLSVSSLEADFTPPSFISSSDMSTSSSPRPTTSSIAPTSSLRQLFPKFRAQLLTGRRRRAFFVALALFVGLFYSSCPTPTIAYMDTAQRNGWPGVPDQFFPYLFSLHTGAYVCSTCIFVVYAALRRNKPYVARELCLPALGSGFIWSGGLMLWFLSADKLGQSFTGPITAMMPGCVGSLWSVFYFREVKPGRSYAYLVVATLLTLAGALAMGMSK